jgi:hypothetical protein
VAKNLAYNIVNHRKRHGFFTRWEELLEVKDFPKKALEEIKQRATIGAPRGLPRGEEFTGSRRIKPSTIEREKKKPRGYSKAIRTTRESERQKPIGENVITGSR